MSTKRVQVPNIHCGHCVKTIERELGDLEGVQAVRADEAGRTVEVTWDDAVTDWSVVSALLEDINYPAAG
jgi:copper chaperone CopZ